MSIRQPERDSRTVDLLRHGETEAGDIFRGQVEDPLSETGWVQMGAAVAQRQWDLIITSPLGRCRNFAVRLGDESATEVITDPRLAEYNFGDWDGMRYDLVMAQDADSVEKFFADPFNFTPPNAEEFSVFHDRVVAAWEALSKDRTESSILVVTHGGVIMSILADIMGMERIHGRIDVGYASLSRIRLGGEGMTHRLVSHGAREVAA